jgi:hypothetical protein
MYHIWQANINQCNKIVNNNQGPRIVIPVTGSPVDSIYWAERFNKTSSEVFNADGNTKIFPVTEKIQKGNFLGTLSAWHEIRSVFDYSYDILPDIMLISMVVGKGTRLSPFTQAVYNRKPAFPTPKTLMDHSDNLLICEIANFSMNVCASYLRRRGFRGVLVKWGDEALFPGVIWQMEGADYTNIDAIRFFSSTEPNLELGKQKEWLIADIENDVLQKEIPRQDYHQLLNRLNSIDLNKHRVGVNLGSFAISYELLDILLEIFKEDMTNYDRIADWDPYFWIAFLCKDVNEWRLERERELELGHDGIKDLEKRYPDFFVKTLRAREYAEHRLKRAVKNIILDFGKVLWVDMGNHVSLREHFQSLLSDNDIGRALRELYGIPHKRDAFGNIVLRSKLPNPFNIRNSVIVDATISNAESVIEGGVIIGGNYGLLNMQKGGVALFSTVDALSFQGPNGIIFKSFGDEIVIGEGDRHTTILLPTGAENLVANESISNFLGQTYSQPILGNKLSFEEAGEKMASFFKGSSDI